MSIATHGSGKNANQTVQGTLTVEGAVVLRDGEGNALLATALAVPADTGAGFAKGCLFIDTDVASGTSGLYVNIGTKASCIFKLVTNAA